ncbi:MAG TPA: DUF2339 domain-containing protein [Terriglobales bacterium]|nr:DUF2339 domain-containing protein [Terriglobales bacterium]
MIVLGPWVFVSIMGVRRRRERRENEERFAALTQRVYQMERRMREGVPAAAATAEPRPATAPVAAPGPAQPVPAAAPKPAPAVLPTPAAAPAKPEPPQQPWPKPAESPYFPRPSTPAAAPAPATAPPVAMPSAQPAAAATVRAAAPVAPKIVAPAPPPPPPPRQKSGLEELIAGNWLAFIGVALLVFGIAFGASVFWEKLGPAGKDAIGILAGLALLGGGVWLEQKPKYKLFARVAIGGGWAVLFFMTYALHHIAATRIIESQVVDLVLLLAVAAAMVTHTLRYDSQAVTGVAFLLAFTTVTISRDNVYSLVASAILAIALVVIVTRKRWFELEVFGILASYLNHWWWLHSIIEPMSGAKHMFPEFFPSAGILLLYWGAYRASYVLRSIEHDKEESVSTVAALLNTFLLLFVLKYQSVTPKYAFYALLVLGAVEFALGLLTRARERRTAFVVLSTIGACLLVAAFPFKFTGGDLSIIWLLEAEAFYAAGVFTDEMLFRRFGRLAEMVVTVQLFYAHPLDAPKDWHNALVFGLAAVLFGTNSHLVPWRWPKIFETQWEKFGVKVISWLGVAMAMTAIWLAVPEAWNAVGWAALALWLALAGYFLAQEELSYQANVVAIATTICALIVNMDDTRVWHGVTMRLVTVSIVAILLYATARFSITPRLKTAAGGITLRPIYTWAAALLVALLAFDEISEPWIAAIWVLFALLLAVLGRRQKLRDLVLQANVLALLSFAYALVINTSHGELWRFGLTTRLAGTAIVAAALYVQAQWSEVEDWPWTKILGLVHAWAASFLVAWLMWYELRPVSVAVAWTLFGVGLLELGLARPKSDKQWRLQGYLALGAGFLRIFFVNLNAPGGLGEISARVYTIVPIALLLFYSYARMETAPELEAKELTRRGSGLLAWMGSIAVVALVRFELPPDWVVSAWAALVIVLLAVGWQATRRTFVAQGLLLTVAIAFRASMHNFYGHSYFANLNWGQRWMPVGSAVALLLVALYPAFQIRASTPAAAGWFGKLLRRPEQPIFFVAVGLMSVLLYLEASHTAVTVAWGVEAVIIFVFALLVRERSFRLTGLAILLVGIGKIVFFDIWSFTGAQKFVTLVLVGIATVAISLLYKRYEEAIKGYL